MTWRMLLPLAVLAHSTSALAGYQYLYYQNALSAYDATQWTVNGGINATNGSVTAPSTNGGSMIWNPPNPAHAPNVLYDNSGTYEVRTYITLTTNVSGGNFATYLRASGNALYGPVIQGTYYVVELQNPTWTNGSCSATLAFNKTVAGSTQPLYSLGVPCHTGAHELRVVYGNGYVIAYLDNVMDILYYETGITGGLPGVGARSTPGGNFISGIDIGKLDAIAPAPVNSQQIATFS